MSLPVDADHLLAAVASAFSRNILPHIHDSDARLHAEAALGLIVRNVLALRRDLPTYREQMICSTEEVRTTLHDIQAGSKIFRPENASQLLEALTADSDWHRRFQETAASLSGDPDAQDAGVFCPSTQAQMTLCLQRQFPDDPAVHARNVRALQGGGSKQTVMFDKVGGDGAVESLVMRRDFPDPYFGNTVKNEFPVIQALHAKGFPVPQPVWIDTSSTCFPEAFMVTRRIIGRPAGGPKGADTEVSKDPMFLMADLFAQLHAIDPGSLDVEGLSNARVDERYVLSTIDVWEERYLAVVETPAVAMLLAFAWLRANRNAGLQDAAIVHGDPGFHNILVSDDGAATLLDWEFVHIGAQAEDLCYARGQLKPLGPFERFLDIYESRGGRRPSDDALEFYEIFRLARGATMFAAKVAEFNKGYSDQLPGVNAAAYLYTGFVKQLSRCLGPMMTENRFLSCESTKR